MRLNTTLVINSKGGAGKTTVATNLASYFAVTGVPSALLDYDPQGSSLNWLQVRSPELAKIHGANGANPKTGLRSIAMHVPQGVKQLVIDAPAGASGLLLQELLGRSHCLLIPVQPSPIDIHATANFIRDVMVFGRVKTRNVRLAVLANRVRRGSPVYQPLERFLSALSIPFLTRLADSDVFVQAAETGVGIFEMDESVSRAERAQFMPIVEWVERRHDTNVVDLWRRASGRSA